MTNLDNVRELSRRLNDIPLNPLDGPVDPLRVQHKYFSIVHNNFCLYINSSRDAGQQYREKWWLPGTAYDRVPLPTQHVCELWFVAEPLDTTYRLILKKYNRRNYTMELASQRDFQVALPVSNSEGVRTYDERGLNAIEAVIRDWLQITPMNHPGMGTNAADALIAQSLSSLHQRLTFLETGAFDAVRQTETTGRHVAPVEFSTDESKVAYSLTMWNEMLRKLQEAFETQNDSSTRPSRAYHAMHAQFLHEEESTASKHQISALIRTFDKIWNTVSIEGAETVTGKIEPSAAQFNVDPNMSERDSELLKTVRFYQRVYFQTSDNGFSMALECVILSTGACWLYVASCSVNNRRLCNERNSFVGTVSALGTGMRQVDNEAAIGISEMVGTKREIALSLIKPVRSRTSRSWPITDQFIFNVLLDKITFLLS